MTHHELPGRLRLVCLAAILLVTAAVHAEAGTRRAGGNDLFLGLGFMASDEAPIGGEIDLRSEETDGLALKWRLHFNDFVALETELSHQSGTVRIIDDGFVEDSREADTTFFLISAVFNLTQTAVSPFVSAGLGSFDHESDEVLVPVGQGQLELQSFQEDGSVLTAAVGFDGRTSGALAWLFEVRYLDYKFDGFDEDWNRLLYSGYIGIAF